MAKTSIHVRPVLPGSEKHNMRVKVPDYVNRERMHSNEYWQNDTQAARLAAIKERYFAKVGQKMQAKSAPIREGVVVIDKSTSMADLRKLADAYKEQLGVEVFQISIHRDEGHDEDGKWKPNLHAHLVFDWTDPQTGKSRRFNRWQLSAMQTITAEVLKMERGASSEKKHLSAIQHKIEVGKKEVQELKKKVGTGAKVAAFFGVGELAELRKLIVEKDKEIENLCTQLNKVREENAAALKEKDKQYNNLKSFNDNLEQQLKGEKEINENYLHYLSKQSTEIEKLKEQLERLQPQEPGQTIKFKM